MLNYGKMAGELGDSCAMGLYSFAIVTFLSGSINLNWGVPHDQAIYGPGFFVGGLVQFLTGLIEMLRGGSGAGTIFVLFGTFWMSYAILLWPGLNPASAYADEQSFRNFLGLYNACYSVSTFTQIFALLETSILQVVLLSGSTLVFALLSAFSFTQDSNVKTAVGVVMVMNGSLAMYIAAALLINKECPYFNLWLGNLKKKRRLSVERP